MRSELEKLDGRRKRFRAVVEEFGTGRGPKRTETILLVDVRRTDDPAEVVTDHVWFKRTAQFKVVALGDVIEFDADVEPYEKGYQNFRLGIDETTVDYRLSKPANVEVVTNRPGPRE